MDKGMGDFGWLQLHLQDCPGCGGKLQMQIYIASDANPIPVGNLYCTSECTFSIRFFSGFDELKALSEQYSVKEST